MAGSIQGAAANIPPQQAAANTNLSQMLQEGFQALQDLMDTSDELSTLAGGMKNVKEGPANDGQSIQQQLAQEAGKPTAYIPGAEAAAAKMTTEEIEKKKKLKETKLKEKLATLLKFAESLELQSLAPEERESIEEFIQISTSIQNTQAKLQQLDQQQIYYEGLLEKKRQMEG